MGGLATGSAKTKKVTSSTLPPFTNITLSLTYKEKERLDDVEHYNIPKKFISLIWVGLGQEV